MEILPFVDILKVFNNPISEEQAWAVCYQCAHFLYRNPTQGFYQDVYDSGIDSIWISRHGDVLLRKGKGLQEPNGSGKGPPHSPKKQNSIERRHSNSSIVTCRSRPGVIATETDAVRVLGRAIFEALDYGIDPTEERQLSAGLESLIASMTQTEGSEEEGEECYDDAAFHNADDEGIEKDADDEAEHRCTVEDVLKMCRQHLSSKQDSNHHFKAVCRALATEAGELFTFLDKISSGREKLTETVDEDAKRLEDLQRADWACLWVQVMRSLRQGVLLKKIEHVHQPPLEYELTPFEMILEDIRTRRYTLHKIMVNGEIPHKVKNDAHEVILNFIRSRPPLKRVDERKLKPKPPHAPDPHELLLQDIRAKPKLRPVREGKLVVETSRTRLNQEDELEALVPVKRIIKPDLNLLLNNSFDESSEEEETLDMSTPSLSSSSAASTPSPQKGAHAPDPIAWRRAAMAQTQDLSGVQQRPSKLQRRHTIMVCESPMDGKVAQELPPLAEEEDEPSPIKESHSLASLHSGLRPNPSYTQQQQQHQLHHPSFQKTSYSDHDIQNPSLVVTLRHPQGSGLKRRSSMEHRRSLTSLPTGLCAIPEMEDSGGSGTDGSPGSQRQSPLVRRSWSSEQAPPPNPSPPIKARVRAGVGTGMSSIISGMGSRLSRSSSLPSATLQSQILNSEIARQQHQQQQPLSSSFSRSASKASHSSMQSETAETNNKDTFATPKSSMHSSASKLSSTSLSSSSHVPPTSSSSHLTSSSTPSSSFTASSMPAKLENNNDNKHAPISSSSLPSSSSLSSSSSNFTSKNRKNPPSPSTRTKHLSTASIFVAAVPKATSSPTSPSTSSPSSSVPNTPTSPPPIPSQLTRGDKPIIPSLDSTVSSQSPAYNKQQPTPAPRKLQQSHVVIEPTPHRQVSSPTSPTSPVQSRWRHPNVLEERRIRRQQGALNEQSSPLSPRKSPPSSHTIQPRQSQENSSDRSTDSSSMPSRRLSLDSGVSRYTTATSTENNSVSARWREGLSTAIHTSDKGNNGENKSVRETVNPITSRRLSLGERGQRQTVTELSKTKSQEDIERISRWRMLQNDDIENRTRKTAPVLRSPSSGAFDIRGKVFGKNEEEGGSKSFSSRYQQLKQQYQSEQKKNLHHESQQSAPSETAITQRMSNIGNKTSHDHHHHHQKHNHHQQQEDGKCQPQQQQHQNQSFFKLSQNPNHPIHHQKSRISTSGRRLLYESPEALQQHMATEEARLSRWRQLEEGGGLISGSGSADKDSNSDYYDDSSIPSDYNDLSESDLEYVSDGGGQGHSRAGDSSSSCFTSNVYDTKNNPPVGIDTTHTTTTGPVDKGNASMTVTSTKLANTLPPNTSSDANTTTLNVMPKRWENPVECLTLTLEEVTHIRSVLTKAELESLISHPDLYQMVSKSKLCFTCKTTRFSLFGEWGTKCKFCKRTVCSKCLRKMNVPSDHFRNIPVYTLSPTPLSQDVLEFIHNFVRKVPNINPATPNTARKLQATPAALKHPLPATASSPSSLSSSSSSSLRQKDNSNCDSQDQTANRNSFKLNDSSSSSTTTTIQTPKPLQRSQSVLVPGQKFQNTPQSGVAGTAATTTTSLSRSTSVNKGQLMAICCDCKGMIMEIIRASKASLTLISAPGTSTTTETSTNSRSLSSSSSATAKTSLNVLPTLTESSSSSSSMSSSAEHPQHSHDVSSLSSISKTEKSKSSALSSHSFRH